MKSRRLVLPLAVAALAVAASGCAQAGGEINGGASLSVDTVDVCGPDAGHTWTDLYACYFGPSGVASCGALGSCHLSAANQGGGQYGFVCGPTKETCYAGFTTYPDDSDAGAVMAAKALAINLRGGAVVGNMPCGTLTSVDGVVECNLSVPAYTFTQGDIARIEAWIAEGAQDN